MNDVILRECTKCHLVKPLDEYYKHPNSALKRDTKCKECVKTAMKALCAERSKDKFKRVRTAEGQNCSLCLRFLPYTQFWKCSSNSNGYNGRCKDCGCKFHKSLRLADPKRYKLYYQRNSAINHADIRRRGLKRRIYQRNASGSFTTQEWIDLCAKYNNCCLCCGEQKKLTVDHVVPISKGGSNAIENIQPLCTHCNCVKHAKTIDYRQKSI